MLVAKASFLARRKAQLMLGLLRVFGGLVRFVECQPTEGVWGDPFSYEESHFELPHVEAIRMSHASFEDLECILDPGTLHRLPALRQLEVDCLHEMRRFDIPGYSCCDYMEDCMQLLVSVLDHLRSADELQVQVHCVSLLNKWCPACITWVRLLLFEPLTLQIPRMLEGATKLQLGWSFLSEDDMPLLAQHIMQVKQLQVCFPALPQGFGQFPSFLVLPFLCLHELSGLAVFLDVSSEMRFSWGASLRHLLLSQGIIDTLTDAGRSFLAAAAFSATRGFTRPVWIHFHFFVPHYTMGLPPISLELLQVLAKVLQCWVDFEMEMFGVSGKVQWILSIHGNGSPGEPALSMYS